MNITIVGGGNVGTQIAVHCAAKGHCVTVYTSKYKQFSEELNIVNQNGEITLSGKIDNATDNTKEAFSDADVIFVTVPAFYMEKAAGEIIPYVKEGCYVCLIPGTGGGECAFKDIIDKGAVICGLQRVPSVARLVEYGKTVRAIGYRDVLHISTLPHAESERFATIISGIFDKTCEVLPNYLNLTMTPSNPILHTTRLRSIFKDYTQGKVYERLPLFYEEWDDDTSELLFRCDEEVQNVCNAMEEFDLSQVKSLKVHYESYDVPAFSAKIRSIDGFKGLTTPSKKTEKGLIPDLDSRYFTADFSYGLSILIQIASFAGVEVPKMKEVFEWYNNIRIHEGEFNYASYGIETYRQFKAFYLL